MKKIGGWISILAGFIFLVFNLKFFNKSFLKFLPFMSNFPEKYVLWTGIGLILIGLFLIKGNKKAKGKKHSLLPIFEGNKIIGYHKEK